MNTDQIQTLITEDMQAVNTVIQAKLSSEVVLIDQISHYIINSGGKRLRPQVTLLAAKAAGYSGIAHHQAAAIIEFIHTATLLHDDVVDNSALRRGRETANQLWGNAASVLVGDFLYSRSFQMMVELQSMRIMDIMADTTNTIAEGEVLQLLNAHDPGTTEARYFDVIRCKTAKLFEAGTQLGAVLAGSTPDQEQALAKYGLELGFAFQLIDDLLDYSSSSAELGKNIGDDLAEGKPTLPLIYTMQQGTESQRQLIRHAIEQGDIEQLDQIIKAIESSGAIDYTARLAREKIGNAITALQALAASSYKDALIGLAEASVSRTH